MPDSLPSNDAALLFFRDMVEPTVAEFMADRTDKRRGCLACLMVASLTEHYFQARPDLATMSRENLKGSLRKESRAVGTIADVANATKHVLGDHPRGKVGYEDVDSQQLNVAGIMQAGWPLGREVLVGPDRLSDLLERAMYFWRNKLGLKV